MACEEGPCSTPECLPRWRVHLDESAPEMPRRSQGCCSRWVCRCLEGPTGWRSMGEKSHGCCRVSDFARVSLV
eukprot:1162229-Pyramimonas_sp.AAC.1